MARIVMKTPLGPILFFFIVAIIAGATAMSPSASLLPIEIDGWKMSEEDYDAVLSVNLKGCWLTCREAAGIMRRYGFFSMMRVIGRTFRLYLKNPSYAPIIQIA